MPGNQPFQHDRDEARNAIPDASAQAHLGPLLEAFHAGALPATEAALVERHLRDCAVCRQQSDAIALYQVIRAAPSPVVGPELRERVYARIAAASAPDARTFRPFALRERQGQPLALPTAHPRGGHSERGLLSGAVAVIIVALLASVFWALPHLRGGVGHRNVPTATIRACPPGSAAKLPANAYINGVAMTSAAEGWAVGGIADYQNLNQNTTSHALILRFSECHLAPYALNLAGVSLVGVSMGSPTDGWAIGNNDTTLAPVLLHYDGGAWKQVALPRQAPVAGAFDTVRMLSAHEGWIIMHGVKDSRGMMTYGLLHDVNGAWSSVFCPLPIITDVAPVGSGDVWVTGQDSLNPDTSALRFAHYRDGLWTVMSQPTGAGLNSLRAVSPTDIWASGIRVPNPPDSAQPLDSYQPFVAHYNGAAWQVAPQATPLGGDAILFALGDGAGWAFHVTITHHDTAPQNQATPPDFTPDTTLVTAVWRETGGQWQAIGWPFNDIVLVRALASESDGDVWVVGTVGKYVSWATPNGNGGYSGGGGFVGHSVLLHYANGAWTRYG